MAPTDYVQSLCILGLEVVGAALLYEFALWAWKRLTRKPAPTPDAHALLMEKYHCGDSDAELAQMMADKWGGD